MQDTNYTVQTSKDNYVNYATMIDDVEIHFTRRALKEFIKQEIDEYIKNGCYKDIFRREP